MSVFTLHFIYVFVLGIVTNLTNVQDPVFVCEHTAVRSASHGIDGALPVWASEVGNFFTQAGKKKERIFYNR